MRGKKFEIAEKDWQFTQLFTEIDSRTFTVTYEEFSGGRLAALAKTPHFITHPIPVDLGTAITEKRATQQNIGWRRRPS
jgi:hypothetical protein